MTIGIDSMILIYAEIVPSKRTTRAADFDDLRVRSKLLLHMTAQKKDTILLPTVAVAELLVPVPKAQKGALIAVLQQKFVCASFDLHAAAIAAELWAEHKKLPQAQQYDKRHVLRADTMIIASARAAGAVEFYSHDQKCRRLASLVMTARDLPIDDPNDMFLKGDISRGEA
jgi:predicted nucleic acid-binding protein